MPFLYLLLALILLGILGWLINTRIPIGDGVRRIVNVVLALVVVGIALWIINTYVPMAGSIKAILNVVVVVETCVGVLHALGLWRRTLRLWSSLTHHRTAQ